VAARLEDEGVLVSLFIEADPEQIDASLRVGADAIEIHTGRYADATDEESRNDELARIIQGVKQADGIGLRVHAGHGLTYWNVEPLARVEEIREFNIGHSIVSRAVLVGMERAVREMKEIILRAGAST
jgi:pyridoxine 5-phosphate synthase